MLAHHARPHRAPEHRGVPGTRTRSQTLNPDIPCPGVRTCSRPPVAELRLLARRSKPPSYSALRTLPGS